MKITLFKLYHCKVVEASPSHSTRSRTRNCPSCATKPTTHARRLLNTINIHTCPNPHAIIVHSMPSQIPPKKYVSRFVAACLDR